MKNERIEAHQWLPSLDFQPGESALLRTKSISGLDKKKKDKPESKDTLISKAKFIELLLKGRPSLATHAEELKGEFSGGETEEEEEEEKEEVEEEGSVGVVSTRDNTATVDRRKSTPLQIASSFASGPILEPSVLRSLLKDPSEHLFDSVAYVLVSEGDHLRRTDLTNS